MYKNMGMFSFSPGKVQCNLIAYLVQFCKGKGHFSPVLHFSYISNYAFNISVQFHFHCIAVLDASRGGAICWCTGGNMPASHDDDDGDDDDDHDDDADEGDDGDDAGDDDDKPPACPILPQSA